MFIQLVIRSRTTLIMIMVLFLFTFNSETYFAFLPFPHSIWSLLAYNRVIHYWCTHLWSLLDISNWMFALCHILFRLPIREQQIRYLFFTLYFKTVKMVPAHFDGRHCGLKIQIGKKINSTYSFINRIGVLFRKMVDCRWFIKTEILKLCKSYSYIQFERLK